jgi:hypothetical protein
MYKIIAVLALFFVTGSTSAQDFFEKKMASVEGAGIVPILTDGLSNFEYSSMAAKTLLIPKYDPKSIHSKLVLDGQYKSLKSDAEKEAYYQKLWTAAMEESSFSECKYAFEEKGYKDYSAEERQGLMWMSYYDLSGNVYATIWYDSKDGEPMLATMLMASGLDLGLKSDVRVLCNFIQQSLSSLEDLVMPDLDELNEILADESLGGMEKFVAINTQEQQDMAANAAKMTVANYISEAQYSTLLLPEEHRSKQIEKELKKWTYSPYEFLPMEAIQAKIDANEPGYCYIKTFVAKTKPMNFVLLYILSTQDDRILYLSQTTKPGAHTSVTLPWLSASITNQLNLLDNTGTLTYQKVEFEKIGLPTDLKDSKIVYVNLTKSQSVYAKWLNGSFARKMSRYPFEFEVIDDAKDIADCKYRVYLKSFMKTFKVTKTDYNTDMFTGQKTGGSSQRTKYVTKQLFYLYLQNIETGENYKFQVDPEFYPVTFRAFVDAAFLMTK